MDFYKRAFDTYYPVIERAREIRAHYGGLKDGQPRVCSDVVGELIVALNVAEKQFNVRKVYETAGTEESPSQEHG